MKIGLRTIKTAIGAGLAIWIAQWFHLQFASFAAIITILCIEKTKKQSLRASIDRLIACNLSLIISGFIFQWLGYTPLVFSLLILILIPLLVRLKISKGFINSVVIVLHLYTMGTFNFHLAFNEFFIVLIGVFVAILLNWYMPDVEGELLQQKVKVEQLFKKILFEFGNYVENGDQEWNGKEFLALEDALRDAKMLAIQLEENSLGNDEKGYFAYFTMRENQYDILKRMLPVVSSLTEDVPQREMFAQFLYEVSDDVKSENTAYQHIQSLEGLHISMRNLPLPSNREEFETRASLHHLMKEMNYYLKIKIKFYNDNRILLKNEG